MTRYPTDHKQKTREAIVDAAAERIRAGGFEALGVASIMAEAGLTHGGFYAHFRSRDMLLAAAVGRLFDKAVETVGKFEARHGADALEKYVDFYLSPRHRDDVGSGCPIPALAGEARRTAPAVREAFEAGLDKLAERLGRLMPRGGKKAALGLFGEMAGVLALARSVTDSRASGELLAAKRKAIVV